MRYFYSLILYLILPWVLVRLWMKGSRVAGYRRHWKQRFGFGSSDAADVIWVHAVSVGEVHAAQAVVEKLLSNGGGRPVLLTTTTPTGRQAAQRLFGQTVSYRYLPYDLPGSVRRFLTTVRPVIAVIMETEIWPNLYHLLGERGIPLMLLNARLSASSLNGYLKWPAISRAAIRCVTRIAAQSGEDAQRFARLGASERQLRVVGNLKYDGRLPTDFDDRVTALRNRLDPERPIWVAGSTHQGEEVQLLDAHRQVLRRHPGALLVIAPRHPERARDLALLCRQRGLAFQYLSRMPAGIGSSGVLIVDSFGDLVYLYGLATAAFVGGSLVERGGHNPLEALMAGTPVISGPSVDNFQAVYRDLVNAGAVRLVDTEVALADQLGAWFGDRAGRDNAAEAGLRVIQENRGALQRCLDIIDAELAALDSRGAYGTG